MKKLELSKIKLPLTKKKYLELKTALKTKRIKWMDMSTELMFAYQDYWKFKKHHRAEDLIER